MRSIILDFSQFIFLIIMIALTSLIWTKSLAVCPKTFYDEYIDLHQKYNEINLEKNKLKKILNNYHSVS